MTEPYYQRVEREAGEELAKLLSKPMAPSQDYIGVIDEKSNESEYYNPWDIFPLLYGSYSSSFDDMALETLANILNDNRLAEEDLAHEMFREMLCNKNLCDYGTSPRVCFPTQQFKKLLPDFIEKWKHYYELMWERPPEALSSRGGSDE